MPGKYGHVISFRLQDEQAMTAEYLRASFEHATWAEMGRWMFTDPVIIERIKEQIRSGGVERVVDGEGVVLGE